MKIYENKNIHEKYNMKTKLQAGNMKIYINENITENIKI